MKSNKTTPDKQIPSAASAYYYENELLVCYGVFMRPKANCPQQTMVPLLNGNITEKHSA